MTTPATSLPLRAKPWNKRVKRWPGWVVLGLVVIAALVIGGVRSSGPLTEDDRADGIAQRLACPTCAGESVYESQSAAAVGIRQQIRKLIESGSYSDDQIVAVIETKYEGSTQLVPKGTGVQALVWAIPAFVLVCAIAGLAVAFRRWKRTTDTVPSDDDRALVEAALREQGDGR